MKNYDRDLLVMYKSEGYNDELLQHEVECLHRMLLDVERDDVFATAHELVKRYAITQKKKSILKAAAHFRLKPFYFLLNKN